MSRCTVLAVLTGALLLGASAPAVANPIRSDDERTTVCLRTDGGVGPREGICVWVPLGR